MMILLSFRGEYRCILAIFSSSRLVPKNVKSIFAVFELFLGSIVGVIWAKKKNNIWDDILFFFVIFFDFIKKL